jgi:hypothetical protein
MNFRLFRHLSLLTLFSVALLSLSCTNPFVFGPSLSELTTTTGFVGANHPADQTNTFYIDSPRICCTARLSGAHRNTRVTARWIYVEGGMAVIHHDEAICDSDCYVGFTLSSPDEGFMHGEYKVELTLDEGPPKSFTFYIQRDQSGTLPTINGFSADPLIITAGQPSALKWKVLNATRVIIRPAPGAVGLEGSQNITPTADATYTLLALNRSGASSSTLSLIVHPMTTGKADLVVTDFWNTGNMIFYNVKNVGTLASCGTEAYLYKNDVLTAKDYMGPLDPGQERVESFGAYHFSPRFPSIAGSTVTEATTVSVNIRVCADGPATCVESNTLNNCMEHNFGELLSIHLEHYANSAQWRCSTGPLTWPMLFDNKAGWAQIASAQVDESGMYPDSLIMTPPQAANSWMEARIGLPASPPQGLQPFYVPHKCKISARVGLSREAPASASVKFIIGTMQGSDVTYYPPVIIDSKGKLVPYEVDLSQMAGQQVQIVLRVESNGPLQQGSAVWIDPTLIQER